MELGFQKFVTEVNYLIPHREEKRGFTGLRRGIHISGEGEKRWGKIMQSKIRRYSKPVNSRISVDFVV